MLGITNNLRYMIQNNLLTDAEVQRYVELLEKIESLVKLEPTEYMRQVKT